MIQVAIGAAVLLAIQSWLLSLGVMTAVLLAWLLWRRGIPSVVLISLGYQWLFANVGYWAWQFTGAYPDSPIVGDIDQAVLLSNLGLLTVAIGILLCSRLLRIESEPERDFLERIDLSKLFRLTILVYAISWVILISPSAIWLGGAQIIYNLLLCRDGLLVLLIWGALRQQTHLRSVLVAIAAAAIPALASPQAKVSHYLFLLVAILLSEWRLVAQSLASVQNQRRIAKYSTVIAVGTILYAVMWLGGIKAVWRQMANEDRLASTTVGRLNQMTDVVANSQDQVSIAAALDGFSRRFSSDLLYFSFTLDRVPNTVAHEDGQLSAAAFNHVFTPRFLYPNKPVLRSASWLVRKYAGVACADESNGASISFGYMAEFYVDWGYGGMFLALAIFGMCISATAYVLQRFAHSIGLGVAFFMPVCIQYFNNYGSDVTKLLGGAVQCLIITAVVLHFLREPFRRDLLLPFAHR